MEQQHRTNGRQEQRAVKVGPKYYASIHPGREIPLPDEFGTGIIALEKELGQELWLIIQNGSDCPEHGTPYASLGPEIVEAFLQASSEFPKGGIALLLHSPGGYAKCAYQLASLLNRQCGSFTSLVPQSAKSEATLLALGAKNLMLSTNAELGPLDAQVAEPGSQEYTSALNTVQALERLHVFALEALDRSMLLLVRRVGHMKVESILPHALRFVSDFTRPLLQNVDAIKYTSMSRALKVAEEYAVRLLRSRYPEREAQQIAASLVEKYPEHDFVIDAAEAATIGVNTTTVPDNCEKIINSIRPFLNQLTVIGRVRQMDAQYDN